MSDKRKTPVQYKKIIKELENTIALLKFKLKEQEIAKLPPVNDWAADMQNKVLVEKLKKADDNQRLIIIKQFFGEVENGKTQE